MSDWARLGRYIRERRIDLGLTQGEACIKGGVSPAVWGLIERGQQTRPAVTSLRAVDKALEWKAGSAQTIAAGGEPEYVNDSGAGTDTEDRLRQLEAGILDLRAEQQRVARLLQLVAEHLGVAP